MTIEMYFRKTSDSVMGKAMVEGNLCADQKSLKIEKAYDIKPKYSFKEAPKVERVVCTPTSEKEEEIMSSIPEEERHTGDRSWRKHLRIAAILMFQYDHMVKALHALETTEDTVNEYYFKRLTCQVESKEDQLSYHLDVLGIQ